MSLREFLENRKTIILKEPLIKKFHQSSSGHVMRSEREVRERLVRLGKQLEEARERYVPWSTYLEILHARMDELRWVLKERESV